MDIQIITKPLQLTIFGFGAAATNKDYAGTAFKLSGKMWAILKEFNLKNKGINIWVYENADRVFAGVELNNAADGNSHALEEKKLHLKNYAYYKHIGPYNQIKQMGQNMTNELTSEGHKISLPYIEIYGHWTSDETKLETELLMSLE